MRRRVSRGLEPLASIVNLPLTCYAFNTTLELGTLSLIALEGERKRESRFGRV